MSFFKPEDFEKVLNYGRGKETTLTQILNELSCAANAKLEREGNVVYAHESEYGYSGWRYTPKEQVDTNKKALLINVEPIAKCKHPREKITFTPYSNQCDPIEEWVYVCKCGAQVEPESFKECK